MRAPLAAVGTVVALAAAADLAWTVNDRFRADLAELSALERAAAALWDLRPLAAAVLAIGLLIVLLGSAGAPGRLPRAVAAGVAAAVAALGLVVVALAAWVAATGEIGGRDELGFVFTSRERAVTLATQAAAWLPLAVVLGLLARALTAEPALEPDEAPRRISDEMEELWRERLAYSPRREEARTLLGRIQALETAGDEAEAKRLAEEMRRLYP